MTAPAQAFRFVSSDRRVREDRRFVAGKGRFAADIAMPGMRHVAMVSSPHPAARIVAIDRAEALALAGVHYVLDGRELAAATAPLLAGLDTPNVPRRPLAVDVARYSGEWVAAVVANSRALAEDAAELVRVDYEPLPFVLDGEEAYARGSPLGARGSRLQCAARSHLRLGRGRERFCAEPASPVVARRVGAQLDGAGRDLRRAGELGSVARDPRHIRLGADAALSRPGRARARAAGLVGSRAQ